MDQLVSPRLAIQEESELGFKIFFENYEHQITQYEQIHIKRIRKKKCKFCNLLSMFDKFPISQL